MLHNSGPFKTDHDLNNALRTLRRQPVAEATFGKGQRGVEYSVTVYSQAKAIKCKLRLAL